MIMDGPFLNMTGNSLGKLHCGHTDVVLGATLDWAGIVVYHITLANLVEFG